MAAESIAVGRVDHEQRALAIGQRDRIAAQPERRPDERIIGPAGERLGRHDRNDGAAQRDRRADSAGDKRKSTEQQLTEENSRITPP